MKKLLLITVVIGTGFTIGLYSGVRYYSVVQSYFFSSGFTIQSDKIHFCPTPQMILTQHKTIGPWKSNGLSWSVNFRHWKLGDDLQFMQAILHNEGNQLECFYQWPDPNKMGTWLWMTFVLNPESNQIVQPHGNHWQTAGYEHVCRAGSERSCGFALKTMRPNP